MWDLIVSVPDHCLSFYFTLNSWWTGSPRIINSIARYFRLAVKTQNFDTGGTEC